MNPFLHPTVAQPLGLPSSPDAPPAPLAEAEMRWDAVRHQPSPAHVGEASSAPLAVDAAAAAAAAVASAPDLSVQIPAPSGAGANQPGSDAQSSSARNDVPASRQRGWGRPTSLGAMVVLAGTLLLGMPGAPQAQAVNANIATAQELESIKGIGPKTAQNIIHERERAGPYESLQDLGDRVRGIGPRKVQRMREQGLTVSQGAPTSATGR